ncbi:unnamed protein product [Adineta steineri]|uniref:Uncharacterized protein n=1 Tax=Adineta steineri TaxID=433720 RepID=A0A815PFJ5_9BILA|nr:unnamed protein product [Adineta steineri]CAF3867916.1 unnamed protein product [Adineta steineri]
MNPQSSLEFTANQQSSSSEFPTNQQSPLEFTTNQQLLSASVTKSTPSKTTTTKNKGRRIQITGTMGFVVLIGYISRLGFQYCFWTMSTTK